MPNYSATIVDFVAGDDLTVERTITAVPASVTITDAWFTIKRKVSDTDANAVIQKAITTVLSADGHIDDDGADTIGHVIFYLLPADTVKLTPLSEYRYDVQVKMDDGKIYTPETGIIVAQAQITRSS